MRRALVAFVVLITCSGALPAHADTGGEEAAFVANINQLRASRGLPALEVHRELVAKAQAWAQTMAAGGRIWHSTLSDGLTANWQKLGENVGMGSSVGALHDAFVASPGHYANLVDPAFRSVGVGVANVKGTLFVSEVFMTPAPAPAPPVMSGARTPSRKAVMARRAPRVAKRRPPARSRRTSVARRRHR
jgi:uncharacterized protein YkwD